MYIESSQAKLGDTARLVSPFFAHSSTNKHCLKFYYHMKGRHIGELICISDHSYKLEILGRLEAKKLCMLLEIFWYA